MIRFVRLQMAEHRVGFTPGSHIWFGSLDFFCMRVDHDLVQLSSSVLIDHASLPGSDERVEDLDLIGMEGEGTPPSPVESLGTPANIDAISRSMVGLCLHANEARASGAFNPMVSTTRGWSVSLTPS
jgi:hypothetical protein